MMIPTMIKRGYDAAFADAVTAVGETIGFLIPPSIAMIVHEIMADVSIARLFLAGVVPGLILGIVLMIVSCWISVKCGYKGSETTFSVPKLG